MSKSNFETQYNYLLTAISKNELHEYVSQDYKYSIRVKEEGEQTLIPSASLTMDALYKYGSYYSNANFGNDVENAFYTALEKGMTSVKYEYILNVILYGELSQRNNLSPFEINYDKILDAYLESIDKYAEKINSIPDYFYEGYSSYTDYLKNKYDVVSSDVRNKKTL